MTDFFQTLSDDQLAILGCTLALVSAGLLAQLSYMFGPASRSRSGGPDAIPATIPQPIRRAEDRAA